MKRIRRERRQGLTLLELTVVLVIIGLIVGGVLVGADLIQSAKIRATIGQLEKYSAAVNTFREKYGGLPGDLRATTAAAFGLAAFTGSGAGKIGLGDGNGLVQSCEVWAFNRTELDIGETVVFWRHLSEANLIEGAHGAAALLDMDTDGPECGGSPTVYPTVSPYDYPPNSHLYIPAAKLGNGNYISVYSPENTAYPDDIGINYFEINGHITVHESGSHNFKFGMTPQEAYRIDVTIDDGKPNLGAVRARGGLPNPGGPLNNIPSAACVTDSNEQGDYRRASDARACGLRIRVSY